MTGNEITGTEITGARPAPAPSPEETGKYACGACGNTSIFRGIDARGYPGRNCDCEEEECVCVVELVQDFTVDEGGEVKVAPFEGGGVGAEIGPYTKIDCRACGATVWEEQPDSAAPALSQEAAAPQEAAS